MAEPATELTLDTASLLAAEEHEVTIVGRSPWYLAWRRLRRNYVALFSLFVFILIVTACFLAPVYAHQVAHTGPNETHITETVIVSGVPTKVISGGATYDAKTGNFTVRAVTILGPTWWHADGKFVLGADGHGRDVAVRLLYGGLNSLKVGIGSAIICTFFAVLFALLGRLLRRLGRLGDHALLRPDLGLPGDPARDRARQRRSRSTASTTSAINIESGSLWIPTLVISYVLHPVRRPARARPGPVAAGEGVRRGGGRRRAQARCGSCSRRSSRTSPRRCSSSSP